MTTPYAYGPCTPRYGEGWWKIFAATELVLGRSVKHPQYYYRKEPYDTREDWADSLLFCDTWLNEFYRSGLVTVPIVQDNVSTGDNNRKLDHLITYAYNTWLSHGSGLMYTQWLFHAYKGPPAPTYNVWATSFHEGKICNTVSGGALAYPGTTPPSWFVVDPVLQIVQFEWWSIGSGKPWDLTSLTIGPPCSSSRKYQHWP